MDAKIAKNIYQVINWINPDESIENNFKAFYVKRREDSPIKDMITHLLRDANYPKLLFTGPRGCGKETELIKLSRDREVRRNFHVRILAGDEDPIKLIIGILDKVIDIAKEEHIDFSGISEEIDEIRNLYDDWLHEIEIIGTQKENIPDTIKFSEIKPDEKSIKEVKKKSVSKGGKGKEFIKYIDKLTAEIYWKRSYNKKEALILVTNLDKIGKDKGEELFLNELLTKIKCFVIYTFPFEVTRSEKFPEILRKFSEEIYFMPHLNPLYPDNPHRDSDYKKLRQMLTKRVDERLLTPQTIIDKLIEYSAGVPYELFRLVKECARISLRRTSRLDILFKSRIDQNILEEFKERKQLLYKNTLSDAQKDIFSLVHKEDYSKNKDGTFIGLMNQNLITMYGPKDNIWGEDIYYKINPLIKEIFTEYQDTEEEIEEEEE